MDDTRLKNIVEAALLAAGDSVSIERLEALFALHEQPGRAAIQGALATLAEEWAQRGLELRQVASGYRLQVRQELAPWVSRLWEERPARYSRALLETLALIAYRQPITRAEIEEIRGVSVSTSIIKTLHEREWIRVVGHRDVPGRPAMYATTRQFLDYFNLTGLDQLPTLAELRDIDSINAELEFAAPVDRDTGEAPTPDSAPFTEGGSHTSTDDVSTGDAQDASQNCDERDDRDEGEPHPPDALLRQE